MKKLIALTLAASIVLAGCGNPRDLPTGPKNEMNHYPTYGLFNAHTEKSDKVCYELSVGNVVWSILLLYTVVAPVYFVGWSLFNPVAAKPEGGCGIDSRNSK